MEAVGFARAGGAAAAVAARAPAEQYDEVPRHGFLSYDVSLGRGGHDRAYLHALCDVAGVVELVHQARGEADLVAVGAVARRGGGDQLALRQLAGQRLGDRHQRVARAGDAHGLIHIGPAGERVADGAADAGCRAAEGLYLRRVIVRLVLEHEQPGLVVPVHVRRDAHGAGVYLLGLVQALELARLFEVPCAQGRELHEREGLVLPAKLAAHGDTVLIGRADARVGYLRAVQDGAEGGVATVVGPVCIEDAQLRDGGLAALGFEVLAAELRVVRVHGEAHAGDELLEPRAVQGGKALEHGDVVGLRVVLGEGGARIERGLPALDGVYEVVLYLRKLLRRDGAGEQIDLRRADGGALGLGEQLHALGAGVRTLVELPGQVLDGEHLVRLRQLRVDDIDLRLREHHGQAAAHERLVQALHVVAVEEPQPGQALDAQQRAQLREHALGLNVKR